MFHLHTMKTRSHKIRWRLGALSEDNRASRDLDCSPLVAVNSRQKSIQSWVASADPACRLIQANAMLLQCCSTSLLKQQEARRQHFCNLRKKAAGSYAHRSSSARLRTALASSWSLLSSCSALKQRQDERRDACITREKRSVILYC